jgi:hypothetical protein
MVEPAKDRIRDNVSELLDRACAGRVLPKRNVSSHYIIVRMEFLGTTRDKSLGRT